jgi:hypothetical protein
MKRFLGFVSVLTFALCATASAPANAATFALPEKASRYGATGDSWLALYVDAPGQVAAPCTFQRRDGLYRQTLDGRYIERHVFTISDDAEGLDVILELRIQDASTRWAAWSEVTFDVKGTSSGGRVLQNIHSSGGQRAVLEHVTDDGRFLKYELVLDTGELPLNVENLRLRLVKLNDDPLAAPPWDEEER